MTSVARRIANDVSYVTRIKECEAFLLARRVVGEVMG